MIQGVFWAFAWMFLCSSSLATADGPLAIASLRVQEMVAQDRGNVPSPWKRLYVLISRGKPRFFEIRAGERTERRREVIVERETPWGRAIGYRFTFPVWKLRLADVDDDGTDELLVGIRKTYGDAVRKQLFVYVPRPGIFVPKWLGTRLCYILEDFEPFERDGHILIRSRERRAGAILRGTYRWNSFGFDAVRMEELDG